MTKEEFEKAYTEASGITLDDYHAENVTLPCACDWPECKGWAAITNHPLLIEMHMKGQRGDNIE